MATAQAGAAVPKTYLVTVVETYRVEAADEGEARAEVADMRAGRSFAYTIDVSVEELP